MSNPHQATPAKSAPVQIADTIAQVFNLLFEVRYTSSLGGLTPKKCIELDKSLEKAIRLLATARALAMTHGGIADPAAVEDADWDLDDEVILAEEASPRPEEGGSQ